MHNAQCTCTIQCLFYVDALIKVTKLDGITIPLIFRRHARAVSLENGSRLSLCFLPFRVKALISRHPRRARAQSSTIKMTPRKVSGRSLSWPRTATHEWQAVFLARHFISRPFFSHVRDDESSAGIRAVLIRANSPAGAPSSCAPSED